jgi:hypothetical protein
MQQLYDAIIQYLTCARTARYFFAPGSFHVSMWKHLKISHFFVFGNRWKHLGNTLSPIWKHGNGIGNGIFVLKFPLWKPLETESQRNVQPFDNLLSRPAYLQLRPFMLIYHSVMARQQGACQLQ